MFTWVKFLKNTELDKDQYGESYFLLIFCVRVCNEKQNSSKIISSRVR